MKAAKTSELNSRTEKFLEEISLIEIKYQPIFNSGDRLSNHYIFNTFALPGVTFEFIKGSSVPSLVQEECRKLFKNYFNLSSNR